jgi:hypothetical protein
MSGYGSRTVKRQRAAEAPELFAAYRTLAADARSVVSAHLWRRRMTNVLLPSDLPVSSSAFS